MKKLVIILNLLAIFELSGGFLTTKTAVANCPGSIPDDQAEKIMQERWQSIQTQTNYPWGNTNVYESIQGNRITLNSGFDTLSGSQKLDALNFLQIDGLPFDVYAHDGRIVSGFYDGCTRLHILTEEERYSWYFMTRDRLLGRLYHYDKTDKAILEDFIEDLRNAGIPCWREVNVAISVKNEQKVRLLFWEKIGYDKPVWIAWVPEHGYFEINVPENYDLQQLGNFWDVAPRQYLYKVVAPDGTLLMDATFD